MIAHKHRFHGHGSLRHVYTHGNNVRDNLCSLKFIANKNRQNYRASVVVSKKTAKSAVVRNRIRRRLYEIIRINIEEQAPYDIIISVFSETVANMPTQELASNTIKLFKQAKLPIKTVSKP